MFMVNAAAALIYGLCFALLSCFASEKLTIPARWITYSMTVAHVDLWGQVCVVLCELL